MGVNEMRVKILPLLCRLGLVLRPVHTSNNVEATFDIVAVFGNKVERCFDIIAGVDRALRLGSV